MHLRKANDSAQRRKNRLRYFTAKGKLLSKVMSAKLSPQLQKFLEAKTTSVHKDDVVQLFTSEEKIEGKVVKVDRRLKRLMIEGIGEQKEEGFEFKPVMASDCLIVGLNNKEKRKERILKRRIMPKSQKMMAN